MIFPQKILVADIFHSFDSSIQTILLCLVDSEKAETFVPCNIIMLTSYVSLNSVVWCNRKTIDSVNISGKLTSRCCRKGDKKWELSQLCYLWKQPVCIGLFFVDFYDIPIFLWLRVTFVFFCSVDTISTMLFGGGNSWDSGSGGGVVGLLEEFGWGL